MTDYFRLIQPILYRLDEEKAHKCAIFALKHGLVPPQPAFSDDRLKCSYWGLSFNNPVGLAAGFDKNAEAINGLFKQGFGFIETGTVTPRPQEGNPKPRLFRSTEDEAIINRMGMPNKGVENYLKHMRAFQQKRSAFPGVVIGANIGKNKDTTDDMADYLSLLKSVYTVCDYITLNISSPNTPGLRQLQKKEALSLLVKTIASARVDLAKEHQKSVPILVKIAPDLSAEEQEDIAEIVLQNSIDGLIVGNTTISQRSRLKDTEFAKETGGLSGKPLFSMSTLLLANMFHLTRGSIPIIGLGGIASAEDAYAKIRAGASLVQIYSSLIFQGFALITQIKKELPNLLERDGFKNVSEAVGVDANK